MRKKKAFVPSYTCTQFVIIKMPRGSGRRQYRNVDTNRGCPSMLYVLFMTNIVPIVPNVTLPVFVFHRSGCRRNSPAAHISLLYGLRYCKVFF